MKSRSKSCAGRVVRATAVRAKGCARLTPAWRSYAAHGGLCICAARRPDWPAACDVASRDQGAAAPPRLGAGGSRGAAHSDRASNGPMDATGELDGPPRGKAMSVHHSFVPTSRSLGHGCWMTRHGCRPPPLGGDIKPTDSMSELPSGPPPPLRSMSPGMCGA